MQRLEVSGAVRPIYGSLGVKGLNPVVYAITTGPSKGQEYSDPKLPSISPETWPLWTCTRFDSRSLDTCLVSNIVNPTSKLWNRFRSKRRKLQFIITDGRCASNWFDIFMSSISQWDLNYSPGCWQYHIDWTLKQATNHAEEPSSIS